MWSWWEWAAAVLVGAACLCAHTAVEALWLRPRRLDRHFARHGVRGPGYRFFVGTMEMVRLAMDAASRPMEPANSHDIVPRVLPFYPECRKLYGPKHLVWFGPKPRLVISSPELIREVLVVRAEHFNRYEEHPLICQFEGYGLTNLNGEAWSRHRRILTPAFHTKNLNPVVPFIADTVRWMGEVLVSLAAASSKGEAEVDVVEWFRPLPQEVITLLTLGRRQYDAGRAVLELLDELGGPFAQARSKVFIPGYRFLPLRSNVRVWRIVRKLRKGLAALIANHQQTNGGGGMKDVVSFMAPTMTANEMIEESKNLFFAGKETLSSLLTWATVALAMHPEWQERARQEVLAIVGHHDIPSKDHLPKLKTLSMIVKETLRLYPPAVAMIRMAKQDLELDGCLLPAGTEVVIPILAVHHDADHWGADATKFNPARFGDSERPEMAFIPFGAGERVCIGRNLALMEVKVALAVLLQGFVFRLSPAYVHAPQLRTMLHPQHGAPVIFRPLC